MAHSFASLDELGDGYGFRKIRRALGVTAFGVNGVVFAPGDEGFPHFHDEQDELYFVHRGRARFRVGEEERELGPGDGYAIPGGVPHGCVAMGDAIAVDSFNPVREDYQ